MSKFIVAKKHKIAFTISLVLSGLCLVGIIILLVFFANKQISQKQLLIQTIQYLALILCIFIPIIIEKLNYNVGIVVWVNIYSFAFVSIFLGSIINIYDRFWPFDILVHFYSGIFASLIAFSVAKNIPQKWLQFLFCITISTSVGVLWEFYEFSFDRILSLNMQRTANVKTEEPFIGWHAISDTMLDLFCDFCGGCAISLLCFWGITKNSKFLISKK